MQTKSACQESLILNIFITMDKMKIVGIFLAAGRGSRLAPLTDTIPKPMMDIQGKSILERSMTSASFVDRFNIVVHWLKEQIIAKIGTEYKSKLVGYTNQENPKGGTMQAFRLAAQQSLKDSESEIGFCVFNADNINADSYYDILKEAIYSDPNKSYAVAKKFEDRSRLSEYGVFQVDSDNNLLNIIEKPQEYVSDLANIGMYYFPPKIKEYLDIDLTNGNSEEYITELYNHIRDKIDIQILSGTGTHFAVTNPSDLEAAQSLDL